MPKWCSAACRQRAWEQTRAAASGLAAVEVVERVVAASAALPKQLDWVPVLAELTRQLDTGGLYDRNLQATAEAIAQLIAAYERRSRHSGR